MDLFFIGEVSVDCEAMPGNSLGRTRIVREDGLKKTSMSRFDVTKVCAEFALLLICHQGPYNLTADSGRNLNKGDGVFAQAF